MTFGVVDTCGDEIPTFGGIESTTSWLMNAGISLTEVRATRPMFATPKVHTTQQTTT